MIIRIEKSGGSFRGAGLYYLHDKADDRSLDRELKPATDERVWFTDTRNLLETDPQRALDEMWFTAGEQTVLKRANGIRTSGRACEDPVKTISLSWHKDDQPAPEHMVEAADAFLKHMGWQEHQAVYVAHRDTEHRHIHIILNKVHPETGRTLDDYREQKRGQSWALTYEREQGQVRCDQREINAQKQVKRDHTVDKQQQAAPMQAAEATNDRQPATEPAHIEAAVQYPEPAKARAANDHLPHNVIMLARPTEQEFKADEQARAHHADADRAELKAEQRAEREAFFKDGAKLFKATRHAVYDEVRREHRIEWRNLYRDTAAARRSVEKASDYAVSRAHFFAKDGQWDRARDAFKDRNCVRDAVEEQLAASKADLIQRQKVELRDRQRDACDALRQVRDLQYQELLQRQRGERAALGASETLEAAGVDSHRHVVETPRSPQENAANENRSDAAVANRGQTPETAPPVAVPMAPDVRLQQQAPDAQQIAQHVGQSATIARTIDQIVDNTQTAIEAPRSDSPEQSSIAPVRGASDLLAGGIGGAASYLADQLGELFAPTPPEVREEQAKQAAKSEASKQPDAPAPEKPVSDYDRLIAEAIRIAQADQQWWQERDRGKGFERDQ